MLVKVRRYFDSPEEADEGTLELVRIATATDTGLGLIGEFDDYLEITYRVPDIRARDFGWLIDNMPHLAVMDSFPEPVFKTPADELTNPSRWKWPSLKTIIAATKLAIHAKRLTLGI